MDRLTAADSWFLELETPTVHVHVTGLLILDPSTAPRRTTVAALRRRIASRINRLPMMRRRVVPVPLGIDHACWIEDPDFDVARHLHHHRLAGDGSHEDLLEVVGEFASAQLDRARPLWDALIVDGLADGNLAVVLKMHHCIVDGVTGLEVLAELLDLTPTPPRSQSSGSQPKRQPDRVPSRREMFASAAWHRATTPTRLVEAALGATASVGNLAVSAVRKRVTGADSAAHPIGAVRTPFNGSLTARRVVATDHLPLEDFRTVAHAFGVTVNDVVLACCATSLRSYLAATGDGTIPDRPLVCSVPVSTHGHDDHDHAANQVSNMFVNLPVQLPDAVSRLTAIHAGSVAAKEVQATLGEGLLGEVMELVPGPILHLGAWLFSATAMADHMAPVHNLIVSNVVGAPCALYLAGAQVVGMYPFGPLMEGSGLNISVVSTNRMLDIGVIACPELVAEPALVTAGIKAGLDELVHRAQNTE